jgi:hypothetical protein
MNRIPPLTHRVELEAVEDFPYKSKWILNYFVDHNIALHLDGSGLSQ